MSYLLQHLTRRVPQTRARVDEQTRLNRPDFDGGAYVRVFVEDTTARKWRRHPPDPRIRLRIADCTTEIYLEFSLETAGARENSLYKIDTLLGALNRFRSALDAEAELYAQRDQHRSGSTRQKGGSDVVPEACCNTSAAAAGSDPRCRPGSKQRRRLHLGGR